MLHRSIGIEPPRLHCGRAANYGSIIVPNTCRRLHREQPGFYRVSCIARPSGVVAHSRKRLRGSAHSVGNVPDACMFGFQGSLSGKALRKQICLASCGENPLTIRWVMLSDFWTFLFSLSPFNGHWTFFRPLSGIAPNIFLLRKAEGRQGRSVVLSPFNGHFFEKS